mgnify:FL=1
MVAVTLRHRRAIHRQAGFSLVELMIGMVIALIGTIVIFQVFAFNESYKRTTTAAGDAQQSGSFSTYMLERTLRLGGAGFAHMPGVWACPLTAQSGGAAMVPPAGGYPAPFNGVAPIPNPLRIAPVLIVNGGAAANGSEPDTVIVMGGQHPTVAMPLRMPTKTPPPAAPTNTIELQSTVGIAANDLLLASDPNVPGECRVVQSQIAGTTGAVAVNSITLGGAYNPTNSLTGYTDKVNLADIGNFANEGRAPIVRAFAVDSTANALRGYDILLGRNETVADNIVNIQAVYGVTNDATSDVVTCWAAPTGAGASGTLSASAADIARIRAVRVVVVARSAQLEKATGELAYTAPDMTLFGDITAAGAWCGGGDDKITFSPAQKQNRYRTYDITIPLRNMLLMNKI